MTIAFKRGRNVQPASLHYLALLYGDFGSGKTTLATSAPSPAILLCEQNGEQAVISANPDAPYTIPKTADDVREFVGLALDGTFASMGIESLVFDGLTAIQQLFKEEILARKEEGADLTLPEWGELNERMRRFCKTIRDLGDRHNVVCTALAEDESVGEVRYVLPMLQGRKLPGEVGQYFHLVGYVYKRAGAETRKEAKDAKADKADKGPTVEHVTMFDGPSRYKVKNCNPVRGTRTDNVAAWFRDLREHAMRAATTPAPEPTAEPAVASPEIDADKTPTPEPGRTRGRRRTPRGANSEATKQRENQNAES